MKHLLPSRTITGNLSGILFIAIILVVTVIGLFLNHIFVYKIENELNSLAESLTLSLADSLAKPLIEKDRSAVASLAGQLRNFKVLNGIKVSDAGGRVVFSMLAQSSPQMVSFRRPVIDRGRTVGWVETTFTKDVRTRVRQGIALAMVAAIIILSAVILLATMLVLKFRLLRQLSLIRQSILKIASGDYEIRLGPMPLADVNSIAVGVNEMARQIAERTENLKAQIKARKEAVNLLAESEQRYQAMLEASPDPLVIVDGESAILYFNPAFTEVFGWNLEDCRSKPTECLFPENGADSIQRLFRRLSEGEIISGMEAAAPEKGGVSVPVSVSAAAYRDSEGKIIGFVISLKDQRLKKSMEQQLTQAQKMHAIGILAAGIAHDMNNLFMGIQGYTSLMQLSADKNSQSWERLKKIEQCVATGATLTRQLLGIARGGKYEVKTIDVNVLVSDQNSFFGRSRKDVSITSEFQEDLWRVEADKNQMELVLLNLYTNAWQSMGEGGTIRVSTRNEVFGEGASMPPEAKPGNYVIIRVSDTGGGMDEETRKRIFEPFFTSRDMGRGVGLGLWSAYGIVKAHDGFITVESEVGRGSTFTVYLPATQKDAAGLSLHDDGVMVGTETILLVDDEEVVLSVGKELLETLGYKVFAVSSGKKALALARELGGKIDLMVLDMIMPEMSGGETFTEVKALIPGIRVLLASGYSRDGQAQAILDQGCDGFIQKPFTIFDFSRKVREILDK
ncbi:MAG: PAS domain S-box protein [Deltaproteobacteria bacterium]|nr:PAS domain S-box protein [Deltaproteobacteria bacterium]